MSSSANALPKMLDSSTVLLTGWSDFCFWQTKHDASETLLQPQKLVPNNCLTQNCLNYVVMWCNSARSSSVLDKIICLVISQTSYSTLSYILVLLEMMLVFKWQWCISFSEIVLYACHFGSICSHLSPTC